MVAVRDRPDRGVPHSGPLEAVARIGGARAGSPEDRGCTTGRFRVAQVWGTLALACLLGACTPSVSESGTASGEAQSTASTSPSTTPSHSPTPSTTPSDTTTSAPPSQTPTTDSSASLAPLAPSNQGDSDVDCPVTACVALTFDDGPSTTTTGRLLDTLSQLGVHATFFTIGQHAAAAPQLVAREIREGHVVGNHTWDHADLSKLSAQDVDSELSRTTDAIRSASGTTPVLVRPPYGAWNDTVRDAVTSQGAAIILWNVDSEDWKSRNTQAVVDRVLANARKGSIVLMHDIYSTTVDAVPQIVEGLRARGLTPVTVPTLLGDNARVGWIFYSQHDLIHPGTTVQTTQ